MILYVVLSRDNSDYVFVTDNATKADYARLERIQHEEMSGNFMPSVYIRTTKLQ